MLITKLDVLALLITDEVNEAIGPVLEQVENIAAVIERVGGPRPLEKFLKNPKELPDVVVLEINGHSADDIEDIARLLKQHGNEFTVYAVFRGGDVETLRKLMHAGVREAYTLPVNPAELINDLTQAAAEKRKRTKESATGNTTIVSFLNAKGGSGATSIAVNVAHEMATVHQCRTVLVDLDIQFGAVARYLDLNGTESVLSALLHHQRIDLTYIKALIQSHKSGLDVLAAPQEIVPISSVPGDAVKKLLGTLSEDYDVIVLDVPKTFLPWTVEALGESDVIYLVMQNILSTIIDAKYLLDQLPIMGIVSEHVQLINNRAKAGIQSVSMDKFKSTVARKRVHRVRNDFEHALKSQDLGIPLSEEHKRSPMYKDIHHLGQQLFDIHKGEVTIKKGLLSKLFG
jgi:pilus assembly protein CpaE